MLPDLDTQAQKDFPIMDLRTGMRGSPRRTTVFIESRQPAA